MSVYNFVHNTPYNSDDEEHDNVVTLISKLDLSYPIHLHSNNSTTLTIVSIKLKGTENYNVWSCAMLLALKGRNKTGFIDNTCRRSYTDEVLGRQWDKVNVVVMGWILNSISEELDPLPDAKGAYALISSEESHRAIVTGSGAGPSQRAQSSMFNSSVNNRSGVQRTAGGPVLISTLISLIKENSLNNNGKGDQANMAGANQILTYTDKNLINVIDISYPRIIVSYPNGIEALITNVENLKLTNFLTLYDVLVVPGYSITLVSVHKIKHSSVDKSCQDLDHVNLFNEIVHEGPDTSYDDNDLNAHDQSDGEDAIRAIPNMGFNLVDVEGVWFGFFLQMGFTLILATLDGLDVGLLGDVIGGDDCDDDE
ncbi:ribonuclease H-like domain-containing protein [Tanacetum coccineum]